MPSITSWSRLEPRTRSATLPGVQARLHDPLWLLARQWQFGEFLGEDAGSPVAVRVQGTSSGIDAAPVPLEPLTQREAVAPDLHDRINAGRYFLRLLGPDVARRVGAWYAERCPVDNVDTPVARLAAGRTPDGAKLHALGSTELPPGLNSDDRKRIEAGLRTFNDWYESEYGAQPASAWDPASLRYTFEVAAPLGVTLTATDNGQGRLDWPAFDATPLAKPPPGPVTTIDVTALPAPVSFPGMPRARWWEFEDGTTDFGAIDTGPEDLGRLLLAEFALVYGNDFFVVPLELPVGTLCRITALEVRNTFGEQVTIPADAPGQDGTWRLFRLTGTDLLFVPPALGWRIEGDPIEEVSLLRDETANLAWAVERLVATDTGPVDRTLQIQEPTPPDPSPTATGAPPVLEYRLATDVPANWYALVPEQLAPAPGMTPRAIALRLSGATAPQSRVLSELAQTRLNEEELPRTGTIVTRRWRYARWIDGSTHTWIGRSRTVGRGEGSSGLRYDTVQPT